SGEQEPGEDHGIGVNNPLQIVDLGVKVTSDFWQCNIEGGERNNEQKDTKA
ncbi:MAG: hypothetical protein HN783_10020, partial [Ilumatobacter sp.]|nr:hypothetical protein [Ilumatobacter sp.]